MRAAPLLLLLAVSGAQAADLPAVDVAEVRVEKAARRLVLLDDAGAAVRTYAGIELGDEPLGAKHFQGDERTPEGRYTVDFGNENSAYFLSLHISYPSPTDSNFAAAQGRNPGSDIFIHGQPNGLPAGRMPGDWTDGCIALSNAEIEELWALVPDGTPIEIVP